MDGYIRGNKSKEEKNESSATKHGTRLSNTCVRNICLLPLVHTSNRLKTIANLAMLAEFLPCREVQWSHSCFILLKMTRCPSVT